MIYITSILINNGVPETHIKINGILVKVFSDWEDFARTDAKAFLKKLKTLSHDELIKIYPEAFI